MLNARKIKDEINVFSGIFSSYMYLSVFAIIVLLQVRFCCHAALLLAPTYKHLCVLAVPRVSSGTTLQGRLMVAAVCKDPSTLLTCAVGSTEC